MGVGLAVLLPAALEQGDAIPLQKGEVGVVPLDNGPGCNAVCAQKADFNIQELVILGRLHPDDPAVQKCADLSLLLRLQRGQDFQLLVPLTGNDPGGDGSLNAPQAAGVGDDDAFYVLDDIAADGDFDPVRQLRPAASGGVPSGSGAVGQGNGFGAAHGGNQFLPQKGKILLVYGLFHKSSRWPGVCDRPLCLPDFGVFNRCSNPDGNSIADICEFCHYNFEFETLLA